MLKTLIPRTDLPVSVVCLGTAEFGAGVPEDRAFAMLDAFVEAGRTSGWVPA